MIDVLETWALHQDDQPLIDQATALPDGHPALQALYGELADRGHFFIRAATITTRYLRADAVEYIYPPKEHP